jgi:Flp pilus assembly protein TadG
MQVDSGFEWQAGVEMRGPGKGLKTGRQGTRTAVWGGSLGRGGRRLAGKMLGDESGQALVIAAMGMMLLMGAMALAVDVGHMQYEQQRLETAADSAALAAGLELSNCSDTVCANMKTAAAQALIEDGITSSTITPTSNCTVSNTSGLAMIINVGPCVLGTTDPNNGNSSVAEVVLTEPQHTLFGAIVGIPTFNLVARAEAGDSYINTANSGGNCVWTGSATINGNATVDLQSCGWYDNGNFSPNSGDNVTATDFLYYGTWENPSNCSTCTWNLGPSQTQPSHTTTQQPDPLANLTAPSQPATQDANNCSISNMDCWNNNLTAAQLAGTAPVSIPPGYYGGGINVNSGITVNLSPGLYYFNGTFNVNSATVECTTCTAGGAGVTLYFENGSLQMNSSSNVTLNAPATGSTSNGNVANMLVWQSSSNSSGMDVDASSTSVLGGIIYLPDAELTVNSGPNMTATALDVQSIMVDGNFTINGTNSLLGGGGTSKTLGAFALAE